MRLQSLQKERISSSCAREQRTLFKELNLVRCVLLQLVGKRHPLRAVRTLKKKKREEEEEDEYHSLQREPAWEHKALSGSASVPIC